MNAMCAAGSSVRPTRILWDTGCRRCHVNDISWNVPIPDEFMQLYCITRRRGTQAPEIARYLQLLQAELEDEDSDQTEGGR